LLKFGAEKGPGENWRKSKLFSVKNNHTERHFCIYPVQNAMPSTFFSPKYIPFPLLFELLEGGHNLIRWFLSW
jgi:hypothetical protein